MDKIVEAAIGVAFLVIVVILSSKKKINNNKNLPKNFLKKTSKQKLIIP